MGEKDIENLHIIYRKCVDFYKEHKLPYDNIKVDAGIWETAIEFTAIGYHHPPKSENWYEVKSNGNTIICPDILNFKERWVLEYEEEGQKRLSGARLARKGHGPIGDIPNSRDTERDYYYRISGFKLLRFYETDLKEKNWDKIYNFLLDVQAQDMDKLS